jgi:hypothetical protein
MGFSNLFFLAIRAFIIPKEIVITTSQNNKLPFSKIINLGIQG